MKFKNNRTFILVAISITSVLTFGFLHPEQMSSIINSLPLLIGVYAGSSVSKDVSAHWAASKDPECNTQEVLKNMRGDTP